MSLGNVSDVTVKRKPEIKHLHHDDIEKDCEEEDCTGGAECIIWQNKWQCMCVNNFKKPDGNGSCVEEQHVQILPSAIVKESFLHRQENQSHPKLSLNTSSNVTLSISRDNHLTYSKEWLFLQLVLPITVFLFLCLLVSLMFYKKYKIMRLTSKRGSDGVVKPTDSVQLLDRMNNIQKNPSYFLPDGGKKETAHINELSVDNLKLLVVIGEGAFGQVFKGEIIDSEGATIENVAVKVLKYGVTNEVKEDFQREVTIMSGFDHDNILRLIGVVTKNIGDTPYMVFEYMIHGDLADMLRRPSDQNGGQDKVLQKKDLIDIATQISNGMAYLASQHFLHRDLATRNCLVGEGLVVKIADFGMTRDIYTCDYYKIGGSRMLPVRWMSPESVKYGKFTIESDVWSYGVVLWEIFSWGRQPYYGHSNEEVIQFLDNGILLQRPKDCPSIVYHLMLGCWKQNPKERMPFIKIYNYLSEHNQLLARNGSVISSDIESAVQELFI